MTENSNKGSNVEGYNRVFNAMVELAQSDVIIKPAEGSGAKSLVVRVGAGCLLIGPENGGLLDITFDTSRPGANYKLKRAWTLSTPEFFVELYGDHLFHYQLNTTHATLDPGKDFMTLPMETYEAMSKTNN